MFIFKNALISITRNKGRNILIGIIILVIALACTISLSINVTANDLIKSYKSAYDKELTISFNRENMMKDVDFSKNMQEAKEKFNNISSYTVKDVKKFADSKYIKSYYYTYNISLNGNNIEKAENQQSSDRTNFPGMKQTPEQSSYDFKLSGYSSIEAMNEFIEGTYEMTDISENAWDIAFNGNYAFINEELATYNNLKINDKIILEDEDGNTYEFEIIGIYKENEEKSSSPESMFSNSVNTIITSADTLISIADSNENIQNKIDPTFIIDDYKNAEKIQKEFYKKGLDENYVVETNEEKATAGVSSIKNVKTFSETFLVITLIIGGVILLIINMINIRERKYEIGVLRTIGISKIKLTMQFIIELMMVGIVALLLGAGLGATMSKNVSNSLLKNEINNSISSKEEVKNNFGGPNFDFKEKNSFENKAVPNVQAYKSIDATVSPIVIAKLLTIGLTLIFLSSLSSMITIQRFSPLTILKERS